MHLDKKGVVLFAKLAKVIVSYINIKIYLDCDLRELDESVDFKLFITG